MNPFPTLTHVIIRGCSKADAAVSGVFAYADVYLGEDSSICNIPFKKTTSGFAVAIPMTSTFVNGENKMVPVFQGSVAVVLARFVNKAINRIKQDRGSFKHGRTYRVDRSGAKELT